MEARQDFDRLAWMDELLYRSISKQENYSILQYHRSQCSVVDLFENITIILLYSTVSQPYADIMHTIRTLDDMEAIWSGRSREQVSTKMALRIRTKNTDHDHRSRSPITLC